MKGVSIAVCVLPVMLFVCSSCMSVARNSNVLSPELVEVVEALSGYQEGKVYEFTKDVFICPISNEHFETNKVMILLRPGGNMPSVACFRSGDYLKEKYWRESKIRLVEQGTRCEVCAFILVGSRGRVAKKITTYVKIVDGEDTGVIADVGPLSDIIYDYPQGLLVKLWPEYIRAVPTGD